MSLKINKMKETYIKTLTAGIKKLIEETPNGESEMIPTTTMINPETFMPIVGILERSPNGKTKKIGYIEIQDSLLQKKDKYTCVTGMTGSIPISELITRAYENAVKMSLTPKKNPPKFVVEKKYKMVGDFEFTVGKTRYDEIDFTPIKSCTFEYTPEVIQDITGEFKASEMAELFGEKLKQDFIKFILNGEK